MKDNTYFYFKNFRVKNVDSAMKIGTDGVLLAAWSKGNFSNILDIGSGTGVISIILHHQNKNSIIDAIEIEKDAFHETLHNFMEIGSSNLNSFHSSLQNFSPQKKYDLIISNPPFFQASLTSSNNKKKIARHTVSLSYQEIIEFVINHLSPNGILNLILPFKEGLEFIELCLKKNLFLIKKCVVSPNDEKLPNRILLSFGLYPKLIIEEELTIYTSKREYSTQYKEITKDLYLKH